MKNETFAKLVSRLTRPNKTRLTLIPSLVGSLWMLPRDCRDNMDRRFGQNGFKLKADLQLLKNFHDREIFPVGACAVFFLKCSSATFPFQSGQTKVENFQLLFEVSCAISYNRPIKIKESN